MKSKLLSFFAGCLSLGLASAQVPTNGLVAYYPLDNDTKDYSENHINGEPKNINFVSNRFGKTLSAAEFDGTSSVITMPDSSQLRAEMLSISVWANPTTKLNQTILGKTVYSTAQNEQYNLAFNYAAYSNGVGYSIKLPNNCANAGTGWQSVNTTDKLIPNVWQLVTSTFDGTTMKIYINDKLAKTATFPATKIANCIGGTMQLGSWWKNYPDFFQGLMDDVRIYNRALSAEEVSAIYNDEPGLIAHYPMDGNSNDVTSYANHGVMTNIQSTLSRCNVQNEALLFNGTSSLISIPDARQIRPENISISVWVNASSKADQSVIGKTTYGSGVGEQYQLGINAGKVAISVKNPNNCSTPGVGWSTTTTDGAISPNKWQLITSTFDGTKLNIYVDDKLVKSTPISITTISNCVGSGLQIGTWWKNDLRFFEGSMDDMKIYNRALSLEEVSFIFNKCPVVNAVETEINSVQNEFNFYPNPSLGGVFRVKSNISTNSTLKIYNAQGIFVREVQINSGENVLDLSDEKKGVYFVKSNLSNKNLALIVQ